MAVDLNNPVYAQAARRLFASIATPIPGSENGAMSDGGPGVSASSTGWFQNPAAAQVILDQVTAGKLTQEQALQQLGPLMDRDAFATSVNQNYAAWDASKKATDASWGSDAAALMKGFGFVAGAGALGGAFNGIGSAAGAVDPSSAMATLDSSVPGMWGTGAEVGFGAGSAIDAVGGAGTGAGEFGVGGAGSGIGVDGTSTGLGYGTVGDVTPYGPGINEAVTAARTVAGGTGLASTVSKILDGTASAEDYLKLLGPAMSIGSGVYGLNQANDLTAGTNTDVKAALDGTSGAAAKAVAAADPWTASGGRALADTQLQSLMRDPSQTAATDPAYKLRIQAAQRAMGSYGQGSGNMAVAGADASTSWLDNRLTSLANLENMGNPVAAQQVGIAQTQQELEGAKLKLAAGMGANSLAGQSIASLGFGVTQATGGNTAIPGPVQEWLRAQGVRI